MTEQYDRELDVRGAKCPEPIIKARQALQQLAVGPPERAMSPMIDIGCNLYAVAYIYMLSTVEIYPRVRPQRNSAAKPHR